MDRFRDPPLSVPPLPVFMTGLSRIHGLRPCFLARLAFLDACLADEQFLPFDLSDMAHRAPRAVVYRSSASPASHRGVGL